MDFVVPEKEIVRNVSVLVWKILTKALFIVTVLPVPVGPVNSTCKLFFTKKLIK